MMWIVGYLGVLIVSLVILFIVDPDCGNDPQPIVFIWAWPVTYPYIIAVTVCWWIAQGFRGIWGYLFGK